MVHKLFIIDSQNRIELLFSRFVLVDNNNRLFVVDQKEKLLQKILM